MGDHPPKDASGGGEKNAEPGTVLYDAFISYRHTEPDRRWAKWLHGALETYRVPGKLVREKGIAPRIRRVFRDEEELPASADLSREIDRALEHARFLIVICSPNTPKSEWVNAEVQRFRDLGRHEKILALLIEGEPGESFPRALCEIRKTVVDASGASVEEIEEVEPLAADVRPSRPEGERYLKRMARLRLLACLLGCRFDDLRQREQERRNRRMATAAGFLVVLLLALAGLSAWALVEAERARKAEATAAAERDRAREARSRAEQELYVSKIAQAKAALDRGESAVAKKDLDECPWRCRQWEWGYLKRLIDGSEIAIGGLRAGVNTVDYSPDGTLIASGLTNGLVKIWDAGTGRLLRTLKGHEGFVDAVVFSPRGDRVASGGIDLAIRIWNPRTGEKIASWKGHELPENEMQRETLLNQSLVHMTLAFDPGGEALFSQGPDGKVKVWDPDGGSLIREFHAGQDPRTPIDVSPDGRRIVLGSFRNFDILDPKTGESLLSRQAHEHDLHAVAFSPDGSRLATAGAEGVAKIWDAKTGKNRVALATHTEAVTALAWSPKGDTLFTGSHDGRILVWDAESGVLLRTLIGHTHWITSAAMSPDGARLVSGGWDSNIRIWNARRPPAPFTFKRHPDGTAFFVLSADGGRAASLDYEGFATIWNTTKGCEIPTPAISGHPVVSICLSASGDLIYTGHEDGTLRKLDGETGQQLWSVEVGKGPVLVSLGPGGIFLATGIAGDTDAPHWETTGRADSFPALRRGSDGAELRSLSGHPGMVTSFVFSPGARHVLGLGKKSVTIWETDTGRATHSLSVFDEHMGARFSPDGTKVVLSGRHRDEGSRFVKVWDLRAGRELNLSRGRSGGVHAVAFGLDGKTIATFGKRNETIQLQDVQGRLIRTLYGRLEDVSKLLFLPGGLRLASQERSGAVKIWDLESGRELVTFRSPGGLLRASPEDRALVFDEGGKLLRLRASPWILKDNGIEAFYHRLRSGDLEGACGMLEKTPGLIEARLPDGASVLHVACLTLFAEQWEKGDQALARILEAGPDVNARNNAGVTPLHMLSHSGRSGHVRMLLENGADVSAEDDEGRTPIHEAVVAHRNGIVGLLLEAGADVGTRIGNETLLHFAVRMGDRDLVRSLLDRGLSPDAVAGERKLRESGFGGTVVEDNRTTPLILAIKNGFEDVASLLIDQGADVNLPGYDDRPPLFHAVERNRASTAVRLLEKGADLEARDSFLGITPLLLAIREGNEPMARLLVEKGADPNSTDRRGRTALHAAVGAGSVEMTAFLLKRGAHADARSGTDKEYGRAGGRTPLHVACGNGDRDLARRLIEAGAPLDAGDERGRTPLHEAAMAGADATAAFLVKRGADPNVGDEEGKTPLHGAARAGSGKTLRALIANGAVVDATDKKGRTALHIAVEEGRQDVLEILLDKGADPSLCDGNGVSPLAAALKKKNLAALKRLVASGAVPDPEGPLAASPLAVAVFEGLHDVADLLIEKGFDVNRRDEHSASLLHLAVRKPHSKAVAYLLTKGADPDAAEEKGRTPLHEASERNLGGIVSALLEAGARSDARDGRGWTPLIFTAWYGHVEAAEALLEAGADPNLLEEKHRAGALHYAVDHGHAELASLLVRHGADPNIRDGKGGVTPLHLAAQRGRAEVAKRLLELGGFPSIPDMNGQTAVDHAENRGYSDLAGLLRSHDAFALVLEGEIDRALILVQKHPAWIRQRGQNGMTLLSIASREGLGALAEKLLGLGADPDAKDDLERRPAHFAAFNGHVAVLEILENGGADLDAKDNKHAHALNYASFNGQAESVRFLLAQGLDLANRDAYGDDALLCAATNGHVEVMEILLEAGADLSSRNGEGCTALHLAAFDGHAEAASWLLSKDADPDAPANRKVTPLHLAARENHPAIVASLVEHEADVNLTDVDGWPALHYAAYNGFAAIVAFLLDKGADPDLPDKNTGNTPLITAVSEQRSEVAETLIEAGADVNRMNLSKRTALYIAALRGNVETARRLLDAGAEPNRACEANEETALHVAAMGKLTGMAELLVASGALPSIPDWKGRTAADLAESLGFLDTAAFLRSRDAFLLVEAEKIEKALGLAEKHPAWVKGRNVEGMTLLALSVRENVVSLVERLLALESDPNAEDDLQRRPVHFAAYNGSTGILEMLVESGAEVRVRDADGLTPLHLCAHMGYDEVVRLLLETGVDVDAKDNEGKTPLHLAVARGHVGTVRLLLENDAGPDAESNEGVTPAGLVASGENEEMKSLFAEHEKRMEEGKETEKPGGKEEE